uniref:Uncharacterized protein n=1 Tax=Castor canadensis TaxID=51338 RepID=A0A8C0XKU3_CASCN
MARHFIMKRASWCKRTYLLERINQVFSISFPSRAQSIGPVLAGAALHTRGQQNKYSQKFWNCLHSKERYPDLWVEKGTNFKDNCKWRELQDKTSMIDAKFVLIISLR